MSSAWKEIPGYPGYEASTDGRIRSWRCQGNHRRLQPLECKGTKNMKTGYRESKLRGGDGKSHTHAYYICLTFKGFPERNHQACFLDGDPSNLSVGNLAWMYPKEKLRRAADLGRMGRSVVWTRDQVAAIRRLFDRGVSCREIVKNYPGLSESYAYQLATGKNRPSLRCGVPPCAPRGAPVRRGADNNKTRHSEDTVSRAIEMWHLGLRAEVIAERLGGGILTSTVYRWVRGAQRTEANPNLPREPTETPV